MILQILLEPISDQLILIRLIVNTKDANHGREIIVKFNDSDERLQVLKGRSKLREQRAKIFINDI